MPIPVHFPFRKFAPNGRTDTQTHRHTLIILIITTRATPQPVDDYLKEIFKKPEDMLKSVVLAS